MDLDLKEALDDLITFTKNIPSTGGVVTYVKEYEGEYDQNDWTEKHPSYLIEISGMMPQSNSADRDMATGKIDFLVLIGAKINSSAHPLRIVSDYVSELEGQEFIIGESTLYAHLKSVNFFARNNSLKVYATRWELTS